MQDNPYTMLADPCLAHTHTHMHTHKFGTLTAPHWTRFCSAADFVTPLLCAHNSRMHTSVVNFTVDAVNRHLMVRRNLRF
jgi:hypothetical protein